MGLNKQGVQYIDKNIPNLISLAADHFLANVLHQSSICRDRRVQGQQDLLLKRRSNETFIRKRTREAREERLKKVYNRRLNNEKECLISIHAADVIKANSKNSANASTTAKDNDNKSVTTT